MHFYSACTHTTHCHKTVCPFSAFASVILHQFQWLSDAFKHFQKFRTLLRLLACKNFEQFQTCFGRRSKRINLDHSDALQWMPCGGAFPSFSIELLNFDIQSDQRSYLILILNNNKRTVLIARRIRHHLVDSGLSVCTISAYRAFLESH